MRVGVLATLVALAMAVGVQAQTPEPIRDFVHKTFIHGVPYDAARQYPASAQTQLIEMLSTEGERASWANAATVLGMIGDKQAVDPLIQFVRRGTGKLTRAEYTAKTGALLGLGYLLNRTSDPTALAFLRNGLTPTWWNDGVKWQSPFADSTTERNGQLMLAVVRALGISGNRDAAAALTSLQQKGFAAFGAADAASVDDSVVEALRANQAVRDKGLAAYLTPVR